jgi:hypothetical protein
VKALLHRSPAPPEEALSGATPMPASYPVGEPVLGASLAELRARRWTQRPADPVAPLRSRRRADPHRAAVERALGRSLGEPVVFTERSVEEVIRLEELFGEWQRARSTKFAAHALHRAAVHVDPTAVDIWAPRPLRRGRGPRADFLRIMRLLWRARERGRLNGSLAEEEMALACDELAWRSASGAPAPSHGGRRCEGRSRAPQGSAGGPRVGSGGSRRGGGDRGDDGGGGGPDDSGGGASGSGGSRRRRLRRPKLATICALVSTLVTLAGFTVGPLHPDPTPVTVTPKVIVEQVPVPAPSRVSGPHGHETVAARAARLP